MKKILVLLFIMTVGLLWSQEGLSRQTRFENTIQDSGNYAQHVSVVAAFALILAKKDKEGFWQFAESFGTTLGTTFILKYAINKSRPNGAIDGHAFPSGHTAEAFSGASFIQRRYGWKFGVPAYLVAGYVGVSRLEGHNPRHDGWDVLAGTIVGIGSTYIFTTPYERDHYELSFKSGGGDYLLGLKYKF
ncbi:membrane-associated phospholipid phosphatase [Aequorivita sublithincola DSM 14238]|uniref:Membrane-associated phospholipid phosphatase n=1 Tax=Aequorivita sublithincola (strain DSM 14238 / LMG 21431 / ACAM 643 / 9-3) TaxID=746697 RepID=I3Z051_AEQSU|nr:phosphatase PAP2 family protein [Aequorivita sublithincola]AFL82619.1 membrane-associated phospholipid phosphatase [Aequorivita sublithincola DSM 14238]